MRSALRPTPARKRPTVEALQRTAPHVARAGLAALLDQYRAQLLRFITARCGDADLAEDLYQDLWIKVISHSPGPIGNARPYLFRMAHNHVTDHRVMQSRAMTRDRRWIAIEMPVHLPVEQWPDPNLSQEEALCSLQEAALVQDAIKALPQGARRALTLYRLEGHTQAEIARIMGISASGVEKHLATAMRYLRNHFANSPIQQARSQ